MEQSKKTAKKLLSVTNVTEQHFDAVVSFAWFRSFIRMKFFNQYYVEQKNKQKKKIAKFVWESRS